MEYNEELEQNENIMLNDEMPQKENTKQKFDWAKFLLRGLSYVLVAAITAFITMSLFRPRYSKLTELEMVLDQLFIGEYDKSDIENAAAKAMVAAIGDRWSFYLSAEEWTEYRNQLTNSMVGIGVTVSHRADNTGEDVKSVVDGGPAHQAGILAGDVIIKVDGTSILGMSTDAVSQLIVGEEDTQVTVTVRRGEEELDFTMTRKTIQMPVATGTLLEGNIGLIKIKNFNANCAQETIAAIDELRSQGATSMIFDLRFNPGGYVSELVKVLDYLLPECVVFRQMDYRGVESAEHSDAACVEMPIAVLVNADSYSAAEFFPACLREYEKAIVVGEKTVGKGYYQQTISLSDGSAVNLSTGKYFTPNGVNLTEVGGLTPDVPVAVDDETLAKIYYGTLTPAEDPQLQAAVAALTGTKG